MFTRSEIKGLAFHFNSVAIILSLALAIFTPTAAQMRTASARSRATSAPASATTRKKIALKKLPPWPPPTPAGYLPITWVQARGIKSFVQAPDKNGFSNYLTFVYLPDNRIRAAASSMPRQDWGSSVDPFTESRVRDWAFSKTVVETIKQARANRSMKFLWDMPFHNLAMTTTDFSLALKSPDSRGHIYVTSGSRPLGDMEQDRRMLIVDNKKAIGKILDFDEVVFMKQGDFGVEGFSPSTTPANTPPSTSRLMVGMKSDGKTLVIFCSRAASLDEASQALSAAGVLPDNQLEADGGLSTTCGYNLPGQYFVEPGRMLPELIAAWPR